MPVSEISGCIGCHTCVDVCPTDVLQFNDEENISYIAYPEDCQICHLCRLSCPVDAITITPEKSLPVMVSWR